MNHGTPTLCSSLLFIFIFLASCSHNSPLIKDPTKSRTTVSLELSKAGIPVDSVGLAIYGTDPFIFEQDNAHFLYIYNTPQHSIDVYNLTQKSFTNRIQLKTEGPDEVNKVYNIFVHSPDSIYIFGKGRLYHTSSKGSVIKAYNTMFEKSIGTDGGYFHSPNEANFTLNKSGTKMTGLFLHNTSSAAERTQESLANFIIGQLDLSTNNISFLPIEYSEFIKTHKGDFSELKPNLTFTENQIIFNWPIESNIYTYSYTTEHIKTHGAKSEYSKNASPTLSTNPEYNYTNEGTWFKAVKPIPGTNYYYRTHWGSQSKLNKDGKPSDASSKPGYLMILTKEFDVITEIRINNDCFLDGSFATDEGIFFWAKDGMNENEMKFCVYSLAK